MALLGSNHFTDEIHRCTGIGLHPHWFPRGSLARTLQRKKDNFKHFSEREKIRCRLMIITKVSAHMRATGCVSASPREGLCSLLRDSHCIFVRSFCLWRVTVITAYLASLPYYFRNTFVFLFNGVSQNMPHDSTFTSVLWGYIVSDILYLYMNDFTLTLSSTFSG